MDLFMIIQMLGGLALFLYGMSMLGAGLEKVSGGRLEQTLEKLTNNVLKSVALGALVTAAIQSSSATTVIVVGLVNSRILKLKQAIGVIMGANIGTTITAHILRLSDISSGNVLLQILKPTTLAPLVGIIGILMFMGSRKTRIREMGQILLGFTILFTGMFSMEAAVTPLRSSPTFAAMFSAFSNPLLGVAFGAIVTAIIQSSSASVGILQALSSTGSITYATAFPIIMGQNIGTCITPLLAAIGATKNAKRSAVVHLSFNIIGTIIFLIGTYTIQSVWGFPFWMDPIDKGGIANFHTIFNIVVTLLFIPFVNQLEKLACCIVKDEAGDSDSFDISCELDERFLVSPGLAIQHGREAVVRMGHLARDNYQLAVQQLRRFDAREAERFGETEDMLDRLEDCLGVYLLKIPQRELSEPESRAISELLHIMSEFERIGDYATNVVEYAQKMHENDESFSPQAQAEMDAISEAVFEIVDMTVKAFEDRELEYIDNIEPLEEVIDLMEETLKERHIDRLRQGRCSVDVAFPFVESLGCLERISDHCANVGVYITTHEGKHTDMDAKEYLVNLHQFHTENYEEKFGRYENKYYRRIAEA